jgi:hypothetical protein
MKIKNTLLVAFCALGLCVSTANAITIETAPSFTAISDLPGILEKIELKGDLMYSVGPNAINAGASKDAIYIEFKQSCGNVDIFIYNENGQQIYGTTVNTSVQQMVIIPIPNMTNNGYSVMLSNANGCAEGDVKNN